MFVNWIKASIYYCRRLVRYRCFKTATLNSFSPMPSCAILLVGMVRCRSLVFLQFR